MKYLNTCIAAAAFAFTAGAASASTVWDNQFGCNALLDVDPAAEACFVLSGGNDSTTPSVQGPNADFNVDIFNGDVLADGSTTGADDVDLGLWGIQDWEFLAKTPSEEDAPFDVTDSGNMWNFMADTSVFRYIAYVFKKSNGFAVYGYDQDSDIGIPSMGTYDLANIFSNNDLSHFSVYGVYCDDEEYSCDDDPGTVVPLPAAGWLLLGGVGSLVAVRRRKKV